MWSADDQGFPHSLPVEPLDAERFESMYAQFCRSQRLTFNMKVTIAENRVVDLHKLHVEVLQEGGYMTVTQRDWWAVIGGHLGWVQSAGNETGQARCGPVIAQQLQHTYKEHLLQFESVYIMTTRNHTLMNHQYQHQQQPPQLDPRILSQLASLTDAELRAKGVSHTLIELIKRKRPQLREQQAEELRRVAAEMQTMSISQSQVPSAPEPFAHDVKRTPLMPGSLPSIPVVEHKPGEQFAPSTNPRMVVREDQARVSLDRLKDSIATRLDTMHLVDVPDDQRLEYNQLLERAGKLVDELDNRLPVYWNIINNEEVIRKFAIIIVTVKRQRELSSTSPQYVINLITLRNMINQVQRVTKECEQRLRIVRENVANGSTPPDSPLHL
ncbi:hypothetical protein EDD16DRAFT_394963 [Pisolithus croceorrhizus]|nr:hypothetical protein EDD16DRAFT_394963 [Pisolithus croceorrhizus]